MAAGVGGLDRKKKVGDGKKEESLVGAGAGVWTEVQVTEVVPLGRSWTRASGGGW